MDLCEIFTALWLSLRKTYIIMDRPFVTIDLAPHLQDFLYHELKQNRRTGELMADGTHEIGRIIQAMVTITDRPRKQELGENPFRIILPVQEWNHAIFSENFIYIPEWKQKQLRLFIEAQFRLRIKEYFLVGYSNGYKQDKIIQAFLRSYNIKRNAINYETVKKYDYRNRRRITTEIANELQLSLFP